MNSAITPKEMKDWVKETWDRCQKEAWGEPMKEWVMELCPEIAEWQAEIIAEQVRIRVASERRTTSTKTHGNPTVPAEMWVYAEHLKAHPEQAREFFQRAGILDADGNLTEAYK